MAHAIAKPTVWASYYELTKPNVVWLIGIGLGAACAAVINQLVDQEIDMRMGRTENRPLPTGQVDSIQAGAFALILGSLSMLILVGLVNLLTAALTFASLIGYAFIYTMYLKRATPQNIVIGGAAGAAPPILGWAAVTGEVHPHALLLFLIIFVWTPPHFWALAVAKKDEYAKAKIPMLPVTHGVAYTRLHILLYTILLFAVTLLPFAVQMSGLLYLSGTLVLNIIFLYYAIALMRPNADAKLAMQTFAYSIVYLMAIFALLLIDHYIPIIKGFIL
jgi:protoheme IX farnesyltransferase